jgi:hypothetical protein
MSSTKTAEVTVGIPVSGDLTNAMQKAGHLRASGFTGSILISAHSLPDFPLGEFESMLKEAEGLDIGILVSHSPLTLYENFRKLVDICDSKFFCWVALDDWPSMGLLKSHSEFANFDLVVTNVETKFFSHGVFGDTLSEHSAVEFFECNPFVVHPFFIFGIWKKEFLLRIWPKREFDYLDTYLLYRARLEGRIKVFQDGRAAWIGFQEKRPHSVNKRGLSMWMWLAHILTSTVFWRSRGTNRSLIHVAYSHWKFSKSNRLDLRRASVFPEP